VLAELWYDKDYTLREMADELDCTLSTVIKWMDKHSLPRIPAEELSDESWLREHYHGMGMSTTEIADELGTTHGTVLRHMKRNNIERRKRNERPDELTDKGKMRELYIDRDLSGYDIADKLDCNQKSVYRWLNKHGLEKTPKPHRRGEDNPRYKNGHREYGHGWDTIREDIIERDGACQSCGISREECEDEYGRDLHVHHVIPARKFDDPDKQNDPKNLIALCPDCHNRWEGIPVKPVLAD